MQARIGSAVDDAIDFPELRDYHDIPRLVDNERHRIYQQYYQYQKCQYYDSEMSFHFPAPAVLFSIFHF